MDKNYAIVTAKMPVVNTTSGLVMGSNREGVAVFMGIPYGGNVSGERRFLRAQPAPVWEGIRDCTKIGPLAMQAHSMNPTFEMFQNHFTGGRPKACGAFDQTYAEDCLVINVLTPGIDDNKRPVLVHVHGGGFDDGSGTVALGGDQLCREEDLVVVSFNHRLNVFGALYLGAFDDKYADSGMVGMLDVVMALQWVKDNIAAFGGDPSKVTIMGESGGCMKVNNLLAMESARGLFRAAICESGSSPVGTLSKENATQNAERFLDKLGIATNQLDKLAGVPAERMIDTYLACRAEGVRFWPVGDDISLPYNPEKTFAVPEFSKDIPTMVGASEDEMASFVFHEGVDITWDNLRDALLGKIEDVHGIIGGATGITEENVDDIIDTFQRNNPKNDDADHLFKKIYSFTMPLCAGGYYQALGRAQQGGAPVYHYMVRFDTPFPGNTANRYSWHTADLPLQFRSVYFPECEPLSRMMARSWAAFVKTGDPSTEDCPWPAFDAEKRQTMVFDEGCSVVRDPYAALWKVLPPSDHVMNR